MLYNLNSKKVKTFADCFCCPFYDKIKKKCNGGLGKVCFEYDPKTQTAINPKTKLPIKLN